MPSSYTSLLGLVLPVTGELSGTWGTTVNAQLTQLIEDSIANYATASVAGGDWTLTTTSSGAANEARMMILVPTGAPGVSRDIYAPKLSKTYIVINRSDAVVVLRGGPGTPTTGTTIPAGVAQTCVWDPSAADFRPVGTPLTSRTGSTVLAAGTTGQRDSAPQFGWLRANSSTGLQEWYTGTAWASVRSDTTRVDVASAATVDLTAAGPVSTRDIRITGTTAITAVTVGVGQDYFVTFSGALTLTNNAAIVTNTGADITTAAGDTCVWRATAANTIEVLCYSGGATTTTPQTPAVRQTVLSGPVDSSGYAAFGGSTGSATLTLSGTITATAAAGGNTDYTGSITNPAFTSPGGAGTAYLHLAITSAGVVTTVTRVYKPIYIFGTGYSTTNAQWSFSEQEMTGKLGNGATAAQVYEVCIGHCSYSAGAWTGTPVYYALMGRYFSQTATGTVPTTTRISASHKLGVRPSHIRCTLVCITAEGGYSVGDEMEIQGMTTPGETNVVTFGNDDEYTMGVTAKSPTYIWNKSTGALFLFTAGNWATRFYANRGW